MPQSLSKILVHLIFATKNRERLIHEDVRDELHRYVAGILKDLDSAAVLINSVEDHVHILFALSKNCSIREIVEAIKVGSSKWIKSKGEKYSAFYWHSGYGAFSVSQSNMAEVQKYIAGQRVHHQVKTFQDEFREFLNRYEVTFDERYIWE